MPTRSVPVPTSLRFRRAWRRFPPRRAYSVVRQVVDHPSNEGRRARALVAAVGWQVRSRVSSRPVDVPVWGGLRLRAHPRSNSASNVIYFTPDHDPAEMRLVRALVEPGDEVVDAGANIGVYTLLLAHLVGAAGKVVTIEPEARSAARLRENVELNHLDQVEPIEAALGAEEGEALISTSSDVSNSLVAVPGTRDVAAVRVTTLDAVCDRPAFVKLDVEGYEHEALRGASRILAGRPAMLVELTEHLLVRMGTSSEQVRSLLHDLGYRTAFPVMDGRRVRLVDELPGSNHNLAAIPADRWDEVLRRLAAVDDELG